MANETMVVGGHARSTDVCVRFFGDELDPDAVSDALRCRPDEAVRRGSLRTLPQFVGVTARTGIWRKEAARRSPGDLDGQIVELLSMMSSDLDVWRWLTARHTGNLFCGVFLGSFNAGAVLRPSTLLLVASRNLVLDLDIYAPGSTYRDHH